MSFPKASLQKRVVRRLTKKVRRLTKKVTSTLTKRVKSTRKRVAKLQSNLLRNNLNEGAGIREGAGFFLWVERSSSL